MLDDLGGHANISLPACAGHMLHFPQLIGFLQPVAHIRIGYVPDIGLCPRRIASVSIPISHRTFPSQFGTVRLSTFRHVFATTLAVDKSYPSSRLPANLDTVYLRDHNEIPIDGT